MNGTIVNEQEVMLSQANDAQIPKTWILIDSQSTIDLFCNKSLLEGVRSTKSSRLSVSCNAGNRIVTKEGDLKGYWRVWFDPRAIASILSLRNVRERFPVSYNMDSDGNGAKFTVHLPHGSIMDFVESKQGLYYFDTEGSNQGFVFVNTIADIKDKYSNEDYLRALQARQLQIVIGRPSFQDFIRILSANLLPN
jgi:hypothetical protein